jgi:pyruvate-formate lyase-activating enzyme
VIHGRNGDGTRTATNPLTVERAVEEVLRATEGDGAARTVSITGGEPLEQPEFVTAFASAVKDHGLRVYLETNGIEADAFGGIIPFVDVVAMDIKLPSAIGAEAWDKHGKFLSRIAGTSLDPNTPSGNGGGKYLFVKVVVDDRSRLGEIESAARLIASVDRRIALILQPESGTMLSKKAEPEAIVRLNRCLESGRAAASAVLKDVRIIPQVHKIHNVRKRGKQWVWIP